MDALTFIAEIVTALIWPITVVLIIVLLRRSILELIPRLRELSYGDFRLEFDQELEQIKAQAAMADLPEADSSPVTRSAASPVAGATETAAAVPAIYPRGAIIEAWQVLENTIDEALTRRNKTTSRTSQSKVKALQEEGLLDGYKLKMLGDLWSLRNMAVHEKEFKPTPQQAAEYTQLAERLLKSIDQ